MEVAGQTVNRLCGSGLQSVVTAGHAIRCGEGDVFKSRYKIVRIEAAQIVIEDMQFESEQELSLEAPRG